MTSDEFDSQYKLLKQMAVKEGRSYSAEHRPSGRAVLVHFLDGRRLDGPDGVGAMIERLAPRDRSRVLATLTIDHSVVVVTQFLPGFEGFEPWLRGKIDRPATTVTPPSGGLGGEHGEFTRLFRSDSAPSAPPAPTPAAPNPDAGAPPPSGANFTDLFRASTPPQAGNLPPDSATIPPIRMVGVRLPFASLEPPSARAEPPSARPEPPSKPPQPPSIAPAPPASAPPPRPVPNFETRGVAPPPSLADWPRAEEVVIPTTGQPVAPSPPPSWDGPSEYSRLLGSVTPPTGELASIGAPSEPAEERSDPKPSYIPLFVVLNVIFILATGLVVYFALRRC